MRTIVPGAMVAVAALLFGVSGWGWLLFAIGCVCVVGGAALRHHLSGVFANLEFPDGRSVPLDRGQRRRFVVRGTPAAVLPLVGCALLLAAHLG